MEKQDKRSSILAAAERLFSELGYEGTSIRLIGKEADANLSMISYYFGSKEGVFLEIMSERIKGFNAELIRIATEPVTAKEKMLWIIEGYTRRILSGIAFHKIMHRELTLEQRPGLSTKIKEAIKTNLRVIEEIIEEGINAGEFRQTDTRMVISTIMGTISHVALTPSKLIPCSVLDISKPEERELISQRVIKHLQELIIMYLTPQQ